MSRAQKTAAAHATPVLTRTTALVVLACGLPVLTAQAPQASKLPASTPTSAVSPSQLPSANPPVTAATPGSATVSWNGNSLQIIAANAGLNRLLRDIAAKTHLQLVGSAPDEQIFGTYGPGRLEDVLSDLLDGVAVNMLFVDRIGSQPKQLVLTARSGGPSLPSAPQQESVQDNVRSVPPPFDPGQGQPAQQAPLPSANTGGPDAPNGVRTPQQIFEQLQRLRQQQQANTPR